MLFNCCGKSPQENIKMEKEKMASGKAPAITKQKKRLPTSHTNIQQSKSQKKISLSNDTIPIIISTPYDLIDKGTEEEPEWCKGFCFKNTGWV